MKSVIVVLRKGMIVRVSSFSMPYGTWTQLKRLQLSYHALDEYSSEDEFMRSDLLSLGFGGLHICKALINPLRNCILSYNGENFGINILLSV